MTKPAMLSAGNRGLTRASPARGVAGTVVGSATGWLFPGGRTVVAGAGPGAAGAGATVLAVVVVPRLGAVVDGASVTCPATGGVGAGWAGAVVGGRAVVRGGDVVVDAGGWVVDGGGFVGTGTCPAAGSDPATLGPATATSTSSSLATTMAQCGAIARPSCG